MERLTHRTAGPGRPDDPPARRPFLAGAGSDTPASDAWISLIRVLLLLSLVPALWFGAIPINQPALTSTIVLLGGYVILLALGSRRFALLRRADLIVVLDLLVTTLVVIISGDLSSPFLFVYYLTILEAAARLDVRQALAACLATTGTIVLLWIRLGHADALRTPEFRLGAFIAGGFFLALLFGILIQELRAVRERMQWAALLDRRLKDATAQLQAQLAEFQYYNELATRLGGELRVDEILGIVLQDFLRIVAVPRGMAYVCGHDGEWRAATLQGYAPDEEQALAQLAVPAFPAPPPDGGMLGLDAAEAPRRDEPGVYMPLVRAGQVRAWLCGMGSAADGITEAGRRRLRGMAAQGVSALEAALLHEQVRRLAATDALTGLANRRSFFEHLAQELARSRRTGAPLTVALLDLNGFKTINDSRGHRIGDEALVTVGRSLTRNTRTYDIVARFGGDEFTLLLPDTTGADAEDIIGRLQVAQPLDHQGDGESRLSLCWGVATWPEDGADSEALLHAADRRLYAMKERLYRGALSRPS